MSTLRIILGYGKDMVGVKEGEEQRWVRRLRRVVKDHDHARKVQPPALTDTFSNGRRLSHHKLPPHPRTLTYMG